MATDIPFTALTGEARQQFERDGFLIVRQAIDAPVIEKLVEIGDRLIYSDRQMDREVQPGFGRQGDDTWHSFRNCFSIDPIFRLVLTCPATFPLVVQLLSPNLHVVSSQLIYRHSGPRDAPRIYRTPERPGWHRDLYGPVDDLGHGNLSRYAIKVSFALTDTLDVATGGTIFAPGSHRYRGPLEIPSGEIDPPNIVRPHLRRGDALLFENRVYHAGEWNYSGSVRKFFIVQYGFRWIAPVDYRSHPPAALEGCHPIELQLLDAIEDRDEDGRLQQGKGAEPIRQWCRANGYIHEAGKLDGHRS